MGGGGAMRAAAKAAGIGVFTGGVRAGASLDSLVARNTARSASAGVASSSSQQTGGSKVESAVQRPVWEVDDWEFAGGSDDDLIVDRIEPAKPRTVFGPPPTLEEAQEATSELEDALEKAYLSSPKSPVSTDLSASLPDTKACVTYESTVPKSAMQAFMFLKESPAAQTVVTSIACDPNVWNAVMQNPVLVEFLQSEKKGAEFEAHESAESSIGLDNNGKPDGLIGIFDDVKRSVLDMVSSLTNFIQSLFAEPDGGKKSESADGTAKNLIAGGTFMALALMVIMVVVMKRG